MRNLINKVKHLIEMGLHALPETIHIKPIFRKVGLVLFFWGGIVNAVIFMFLLLSLWHGFNPITFEKVDGGIR